MTDITTSAEIARPADDVFAYVADMANNPRWQQGQQRCEWTSEPPHGLGSTYDQEARFMGRTIRSSFEVTEFEPGRLIRIVSTAGTMPIDVTRTVEPISGASCTVSARVQGDPPAFFKIFGPLLDRMVKRNVTKDYERLKALLEAE